MDSSERPNEIGELLGQYSVASLYEAAFQTGALPSAIKPLDMKYRLCGRAVTVHLPPANNLWLHGAVYEAGAGDVLVASTQGGYEAGYWGLMPPFSGALRAWLSTVACETVLPSVDWACLFLPGDSASKPQARTHATAVLSTSRSSSVAW